MANLPNPPTSFLGTDPKPDSMTEVVTQATNGQSTPSGIAATYSRNPLPTPASDQLLNEPGVGYPF